MTIRLDQTSKRTLYRFAPLLLLALALLLSAALSASDTTQSEAIVVTDSQGREVRLEAPAKRIVALAPHIVENAYSAGAGEHLVAAVNYSDYPPAAEQLPQLGSYKSVSLERILELEPDLVLMWGSGNGESTQRQLERLGLTVYVGEPSKLNDVAQEVRDIGVLAGTSNVAEQAADEYLNELSTLKARYADESPVSVFYQVWNDPLQTLSGGHLVSDVIELCGGQNIYADAATLAPVVNMESLLDRNPTVIVASGMGEERPEWLDEWKKWSGLTAVQENNLFFVPPDIIQRHTLRIISGAELFCKHIELARTRLMAANRSSESSDR